MRNKGKTDSLQQWLGFILIACAVSVPLIKFMVPILAGVIIFAALLFYWLRKKDVVLIWYAAAILTYMGSQVVADIAATGGQHLFALSVRACVMFVAVAIPLLRYEKKYLDYALLGFCLTVLLIAIAGIYQYVMLGVQRPPTLMPPVHAGYVLADGLLVSCLAVYYRQGRYRLASLFIAGTIAVALVLNGTRGGWLSVVIPLFVVCLVAATRHLRWRIVLVSLAAVVLLGMLPMVQARYHEARSDILLYQQGNLHTSIGLRFEMWRVTWELFKRSPVLGVGPTEWQNQIRAVTAAQKAYGVIGDLNQPHNVFLFVLATSGAVGGLAFMLMILFPFVLAWRQGIGESLFVDLVVVISLAFLIQGLTDSVTVMYRPFHSYLFLVGIGLCAIRQQYAGGQASQHGTCGALQECAAQRESL